MADTITIEITDIKAKPILESMEEIKLIRIIHKKNINWTPKKKRQAKDFISAYKQAKLAEEGKIKLKTLDELINEL